MNEENNGVNPASATPEQPQVGGIVSDSVNQVGYVSNGTPMPKKKGPAKLILGLIIIAAVAALGYFVVYPLINKKLLTKPVDSFNTSIDTFTKNINNTVSKIIREKQYFDASIKIESNMPGLEEFNDYKLNLNGGIDPKKKAFELGGSLGKGSDTFGAKVFYVNGDIYTKLSTYPNLILLDKLDDQESLAEINKMFESYSGMIEALGQLDAKDSEYLVNLFGKLLKESIPEDRIVSEDATMTVLGDDVSVTANKLTIDTALAKNMVKHIVDGFKNDKDAMSILKKYGIEEKSLDEMFDVEGLELEQNVSIVIYVLKGENVGYEIVEGEDKFIYYTNNGNFILEGSVSVEGQKQEIKVTGKKDGDKTNVSVKVDGKELASLVVSKWSEEEIDLTYSISGVISGDFKFKLKSGSDKDEYHLEFKLEQQGQYIKVIADLVDDWTSDIPSMNVSTAEQLTEEQLEEVLNNFATAIEQSPLFELFESMSGDMYYDMDNGYNIEDNGNLINSDDPAPDGEGV